MRHGSLFSGIGGFDLAAEWMGWENVFHCEWMEFPRKVLDYYFPNADSHIDICKTDFKKYANKIDILTGGFPCQPFSMAGKRKGTEDERYLWGEMLRAIQEIQPKFVIAENVFGITNIDGGLVFEQVCLDLEAEGYEVQPFIIPAASKNAPHRRDRCWFIAIKNSLHSRCIHGENEQERAEIWEQRNTCTRSEDGVYLSEGNVTDTNGIRYGRRGEQSKSNKSKEWQICENKQHHRNGVRCKVEGCGWNATDTNGNGFNERNGNNEKQSSQGGVNALNDIEPTSLHTNGTMWERKHIRQKRERESNGSNSRDGINYFQNFPTQSPICGRNDGLPTELDGITFSKWRAESIKGYGNAIVPQVAYELFKIIEKLWTTDTNTSN